MANERYREIHYPREFILWAGEATKTRAAADQTGRRFRLRQTKTSLEIVAEDGKPFETFRLPFVTVEDEHGPIPQPLKLELWEKVQAHLLAHGVPLTEHQSRALVGSIRLVVEHDQSDKQPGDAW
jgi:hypothetical protein